MHRRTLLMNFSLVKNNLNKLQAIVGGPQEKRRNGKSEEDTWYTRKV